MLQHIKLLKPKTDLKSNKKHLIFFFLIKLPEKEEKESMLSRCAHKHIQAVSTQVQEVLYYYKKKQGKFNQHCKKQVRNRTGPGY